MISKQRILILLSLFICYSLISLVFAEKIDIQMGNAYLPGDSVQVRLSLYDDSGSIISENISYFVQDYYMDLIFEGILSSGETGEFVLPDNAIRGYWKLTAEYNEFSSNRLFEVGELEKAEIILEEDNLVITNIGNVPYSKPITISINDHKETAIVPLDIGQTKKLKLTAPEGVYDIRVSDGTGVNNLEFSDVPLTGNVIGIEKLSSESFFKKYPLVSLFLFALIGIFAIILFSKLKHKK
jgi:hypothetical protein